MAGHPDLRPSPPMLAAFFRSNQPAVLVSVPLVVAALFVPACWHAPVQNASLMPVASLMQHLVGGSAWANALAGMVLVALATVQLAILVNALELMDRRNHLVALTFPVLLAGLCGPGCYDPALLGLPFVLFALRRAWSISNTGAALAALFDAALLIGLAALCYLPYAVLLVVLWISTSLIRPFAWREYVLPVISVVLVFCIAWMALHLAGRTPWRPLLTVMPDDMAPAVLWQGLSRKAFLVIAMPILLLALAAFYRSQAQSVMRGRNLRSAFMALALSLAVLMGLLSWLKGSFPAVLAASPIGGIAAYLFLNPKRRWLAELGLGAMLCAALWVRWGGGM